MKIEKVNISQVKNNPNNPRVIKNDDYRKLVRSIKEAPWMLQLRSIVVNDDNIVLGGNQRLRACKDAGLKDPMDQWAKLNPYKANMSEYAAEKVMEMVDVDCPKEGEESTEKEKKGGIASLFRKKKSFRV